MTDRRISSVRKGKDFARREGTRLPRKTMLIVCEGITEEKYFKVLRANLGLSNADIFICDNDTNSAPINIVRKAESIYSADSDYDFVYCVFDRDQHQSFADARDRIKKLASRSKKPLPISEAVSVPSFEFWVLLHYERTDRSFNGSQQIQDHLIRSGYVEKYVKGDDAFTKQLVARIEDALMHSTWLEGRTHIVNDNPMTNIHKMVEEMKRLLEV